MSAAPQIVDRDMGNFARRQIEQGGKTLPQIAREHTMEALDLLVETMRCPDATLTEKVRAATYILDRGWGRAPQAIDVNVTSDNDVRAMTREQLMQIATGAIIEATDYACVDEEETECL